MIESQRGRGIGMQMMRQAISYVTENQTDEKIYLEAQTYAIGFYEKLGFKVISDEFLDEGIPHKGMELLIDRCSGIRDRSRALSHVAGFRTEVEFAVRHSSVRKASSFLTWNNSPDISPVAACPVAK